MRSFVIVVDMQHDFVRAAGALPVTGAEAIIIPSQMWLESLDPLQIAGVLFTFDTHDPQAYAGSVESKLFPLHCMRGSKGWKSVLDWKRIANEIPVYQMEKSVFDMWEETSLMIQDVRSSSSKDREFFFSDMKAQGIEHVIVIGVAADYCVRWAVDGLLARSFQVEVSSTLTRGIARGIAEVLKADFPGAEVRLSTNL